MSAAHFTLNGEQDGVKYTTTQNNDTYSTVFAGQGLEGSFTFTGNEVHNNSNPLEILRTKLFSHELPDQSNYDYRKVFHTSTYFV